MTIGADKTYENFPSGSQRRILVTLVLVAGTAAQAGLPTGCVVVSGTRTLAGGALGHLDFAVAGDTLTVTSSSGTDTSTVACELLTP